MTDKLTPVRCGCGGEAKVISYLSREYCKMAYYVRCVECGTETDDLHTEAEAITAWNRAMGGNVQECAKDARCYERTAKVKKRFMLVTGGMGDTLPLCECGFIVSDKWTYCPSCGARLEWNE